MTHPYMEGMGMKSYAALIGLNGTVGSALCLYFGCNIERMSTVHTKKDVSLSLFEQSKVSKA